jgi:hypothetical protein
MHNNGKATGNLSTAAWAAAPQSVGKLTAPEKVTWHPVVGLPVEVPRPVEVRVRCDGYIHRIEFDGRRLRLLDHRDLKRERLCMKFGADWPCHDVLDAWRRGKQQKLPEGLRAALNSHRLAKLWAAYQASESPEETRTALLRLEQASNCRTAQAAESAFRTCSYRTDLCRVRPQRFWVDNEPSASIEILRPGPRCANSWFLPRPRFDTGCLHAQVAVRPDWYYRVYERGLAVIDGKLVLDILTDADLPLPGELRAFGHKVPVPSWIAGLGDELDLRRGPLALVVYQGRGYTVRPRPAWVVEEPGPDGKPRKVLKPLRSRRQRTPSGGRPAQEVSGLGGT